MKRIEGSFEIKATMEPPYDEADGVSLGRMKFDKTFKGPLTATSTVQFLAARTPIENSAGYVALERIVGSVEGKRGSFVVMHMGVMNRGVDSLEIKIVPDSGTGELKCISGTMHIRVEAGGAHFYELNHALPLP